MDNYSILINKINKLSFMDDNLLSIMKLDNAISKTTNKYQHNVHNKSQNKKINDIKFFFPDSDYTDSLFWCYIIHKYGMDEYLINKNHIYEYEKQNKINLLNLFIKPNKKEIKQLFKVKYADIESNCIYDSSISITVFIILMYYMKINVIYYDNNIYYELINEDCNDLVIIKKDNDKYAISIDNDNINIGEIRNNKFVVDNIYKPLKAISNYKVSQLKEICLKLNINIKKDEKKYITKKEMYQLLKEILN